VDECRADLERECAAAREASRTAATYVAWRDERVTQAAAWVLATVFVRFCEDNGLVEDPFIAGPGEGLADAEDRQAAFLRERSELNDCDWLEAGFLALAETHRRSRASCPRRTRRRRTWSNAGAPCSTSPSASRIGDIDRATLVLNGIWK
jgi:hypothetical protein